MPIKKIVFIPFCIISFSFIIFYILYNYLFTVHIDLKNEISKYQILINDLDNGENSYLEESKKIDELTDHIKKIESKFFTKEEADISILTPYIKELLINNSLNIIEYQETDMYTRFTITGTTNNLIDFLYKIYQENKNYEIPILSISMINNREFKGTIAIARSVINKEPNIENQIDYIKKSSEDLTYNKDIMSILGLTFEDKIRKNITSKVENRYQENKTIDKFEYIGLLKNSTNSFYIFKDHNNQRIYNFQKDQTISGWTYIGKESEYYLFSKDGIKYEVKE